MPHDVIVMIPTIAAAASPSPPSGAPPPSSLLSLELHNLPLLPLELQPPPLLSFVERN